MRFSVIQKSANVRCVLIREDYLQLCEDNHCAALLLSYFEFWTNIKIGSNELLKAEYERALKEGIEFPVDLIEDLWIYKTLQEIAQETFSLFGKRKIISALSFLVQKGFLEKRFNPKYKWDKTLQYRLNIKLLNEKLASKVQNAPLDVSKMTYREVQKRKSRGSDEPSNTIDYFIDDSKRREDLKPIYKEIVSFLNEKTGKHFRFESAVTQRLIRARISEGFTLEDFKYVIERKASQWLNTDMEKYLRPTTLFRPGNFEAYLNERETEEEWRKRISDQLKKAKGLELVS
jgi:uncharacterized phage protein (TIGR02220 family)